MKKTRFTEEQMVTILRKPTKAVPESGQERRRPLPDDLRLAIDVVGGPAVHLQAGGSQHTRNLGRKHLVA